jgi:hypothetical protein
MPVSEQTTRAAEARVRQETAYQRWADDGGTIPDDVDHTPTARPRRNPWLYVGLAAAAGFACGWLSNHR